MNNLWKEWNNVRGFANLPISEKDRIIGIMKMPAVLKGYWADAIVLELWGKIPQADSVEMSLALLEVGGNIMNSERVHSIIENLLEVVPDKTKKILSGSDSTMVKKLLLMCPDISIEQEVQGLRALSTSKYVPNAIFKSKYQPTLEALEQLPPVMRLKTLEGLTISNRIRYNVFKKVDEDKFKALLFTTSMKHTDRVKEVSNKYDELKHIGEEAVMKISGHCKYCGDYSFKITSGVVRTITGIQKSGIRSLAKKCCPFCYFILPNMPDIEKIG